eukprot:jgi/Ulvmu1/7837/UM004_0067.1
MKHSYKEESVQTSRVVRELSPRRVYSKNQDYHRVQTPALFKKHQLRLLDSYAVPLSAGPTPTAGRQKQPQLLEEVDAYLRKRLAKAETKATVYGPLQASWAEHMLRVDVYRQVFEILINAMTTYKPLLKRIKRQYDWALEDAMKSSFENIHLKSEVAAAELNLGKAVDEALSECAGNALVLRDQLFLQLAESEKKANSAETQAQAMEMGTKDNKHELLQLQNKAISLQQENRRLQEQLMAKSSWSNLAP